MSVINATPLLAAAGGDYQISRSVRLRSSASAYFNRTPASAGSRTTWTYSTWKKRGQLGNYMWLISALVSAGTVDGIRFQSDNTIDWIYGGSRILATSQVFRDPSAWYHIVFVWDTTQATSSSRVRVYVNGVQITSFSTAAYPAQNSQSAINNAVLHRMGGTADTLNSEMFDGYQTEDVFVDGQALTPSSFGETDAVTGVWKPKKYAGTYGTNGFYLNFSDNSSNTATTIGKDYSGNGNNWTPNNISVTAGVTYDSMLDVPTLYADGGNGRGNYCTLNPLAGAQLNSLTNGNLTAVASQTLRGGANATIAVRTGKWYWEHDVGTSGEFFMFGIRNTSGSLTDFPGADSNGYGYYGQNGNKYTGGSATAYGATFASGDVVGVAFDADAGTLTFYKNNVSQGTAFSSIPSGDWFPAIGDGSTTISGSTVNINFGQRPFAYTPPTGFKALNTQNLPEPTIKKGNQYFNTVLYTGNATARSITGVGFQPDFVWTKSRSGAESHRLYDAVRGTTQSLYSNLTNAETTEAQSLTAFGSDGFSLGTGAPNSNAVTYAAWNWKESPSAGFDIVTYTGNGSTSRTISHNLGVRPSFIAVKSRNDAIDGWYNYHISLGATKAVFFNLTNAATTSSNYWNDTEPTSSVFTVRGPGTTNRNADGYVAYLFAEVAGFSKFGSYTGNGSADGPFQYLGFAPAFIMLKRTDSTGNWAMYDRARSPKNADTKVLYPNLSNTEDASTDHFDWLSNGFKMKSTNQNTSGGTFIYAAFAENPFKNSLAR